ncbi:hypothetical protein [Corynebacterium liangguodongii]|uniref:Uncharacterized protein n=1 Tax=Corynebacterium liangguodongii TaxID=2079535 RepID=A0A2S0WF72_9CORY|nr:hypothetical protein [Corynebacterium liangguodongii]AWB84418.1 hypothetical protein C3E79_07925 [Corynebacterium liangguodongii]PWB99908.1 hypothetical protein DF219_04520 [Corynebacterium liangguodongii]
MTDLLDSTLALLEGAGITLSCDIERDDVEDALVDDLPAFRAHPITTMATLRDPDEALMFTRVWCDTGVVPRVSLRALRDCAAELCRAAGTELTEFVALPDTDTTGSVRLRVGDWDVADVDYDLAQAPELDLIAAVVPAGVTAITVEHDDLDAHSVTLFASSGPGGDALAEAVEREVSSGPRFPLNPDAPNMREV